MKKTVYFVVKVNHQTATELDPIVLDGENGGPGYEKIYNHLKSLLGEDIKLHGHNFHYISKGSHHLAAGYVRAGSNAPHYFTWRGPAHFNPEFYDVMGSVTYDEEQVNKAFDKQHNPNL